MIDSIEFEPSPAKLVKELRGLSEDLQRKAVDAGLVTSMKPIKAAMKTTAPRNKHGYIADSIGHRNVSKTAKARLGIDPEDRAKLVGPTKKVNINDKKIGLGRLAHLLEEGTAPHLIRFKNKKALHGNGNWFAQEVKHPGIRATYFMANSLAIHQSRVPALFYQGLAKHLNKRKK